MNLKSRERKYFLIITTLLVGMCSIIYELLISTASSYFLGNSIKQFSLIIGIYMAAMGLGAYISKWFKDNLIYNFVLVEILLGLVGAFSVPLTYLYFLYADFDGFNLFVFTIISIIGVLTGLEVPLITRILESDYSLKDNISNILTFDYLGALVATIAFPFFLVPLVGIYKSSLFFGLLNILVGLVTYFYFKNEIKHTEKRRRLMLLVIGSLIAIIVFCIATSVAFLERWNNGIFKHPVIYSEQSVYQDITLTDNEKEFRLYLNGAIQFSSRDEYRYHEALVHIPMMQLEAPKKVLLLGGGEGLAAREILKYNIEKIDLVDLDPSITELSKKMAKIRTLNKDALHSEKVEIFNEDAFTFLLKSQKKYDVIICDLPDPSNESLARLYSNAFYHLAIARLENEGVFVTQATSPELTDQAFWCINQTIQEAGFTHTYPFNINVPTFGNWGFIMATLKPIDIRFDESIPTKYLEKDLLDHLFYFPKDKRVSEVLSNNLDQPILLEYYLEHWRDLNYEPK